MGALLALMSLHMAAELPIDGSEKTEYRGNAKKYQSRTLLAFRLELGNVSQVNCDALSFSPSDVYEYLQKFGLTAAGGRLGPVGVPGLLLAGGINFYGNQVSFGCDTVVNYEIVLADSSIVEVNKTSYSDLFWALKGGSSNFGIVTRFDLQTIKSPKACAGAHTLSSKYINEFLAAAATYASDIYDPKTHIVPTLTAGETTLTTMILLYDGDSISYPDIFKPFTDIPAISSTFDFKTVAEFTAETGAMVIDGIKYNPPEAH
ncbi:hypothetical protein N7463_008392 [Penicillium fimorum]|uniref:FAD-binding PCMH-type domain-containing protein n=1 Tax=Penicillium fimorum TaxID=1882269 RepID=A0A9X0C3P0_9EURO|nr:hypothetical protein N7463_008392 [Penicillium fimorum]